MPSKTAAQLLVTCLEAQGTERVFCVPGESYLAVLDSLRDSSIDTVVARQEGGASMMAEADGKLTGRPGIVFVTRGPGATNASSGVHVAQQDSTPLILFAGQVERSMRGRDAFQELDFPRFYGGMAKWVTELRDASQIPEAINRAFHTAMSGRPGPVVIALPEDLLTDPAHGAAPARIEVAEPAPTSAAMAELCEMLRTAQKPMIVAGGSRWTDEAVLGLQAFAERWQVPVGCVFRRQQLFDHLHPNYAGDIGIGANPELTAAIKGSDLIVLLGTRLSEIASQSYTLLDTPKPKQPLVHIHPSTEELGRVYRADLAINATPASFLDTLAAHDSGGVQDRAAYVDEVHASYLDWSEELPEIPGPVQMGRIMGHLRDVLEEDAIVTNGAGNYSGWVHRYFRFRRFRTQVAPTAGSMGYGLPAAIAAKLRFPEREVLCFAGDGCFQMTGQEFGTAAQVGANVIVVVVDNGMYGTIRMHQERHYPERVHATGLKNPDFAALARAYGGHGETVTATEQFAPALQRARTAGVPAIIHVHVDPEAITATATLSQIRGS
ncbi:MAG: thiamine pyrophosphate-binding protein [Gammaproteobacteria bacterium]|nr:thiamine pyrophosphate-binding protein [Gammaproteobacteria bacterium]